MASESHFLRSIIPTLPSEIAAKIRSLCATSATNETVLENLVRFLIGGEHAPDSSKTIQEQWAERQVSSKKVITSLLPAQPEKKRAREDEGTTSTDSQLPKKQRISGPTSRATTPIEVGPPLYTIHSISTTSPVRKKVDITVHKNALTMTNPTTHAIEATVPLSSLRRAFIVPTRGKTKPHWTLIILSSDIADKTKPAADNHQVIFGVDATTPNASFSTSSYNPSASGEPLPTTTTLTKGSPTLPSLHTLLSHIPIPLIEPSVSVFKSACNGIGASACPNGIPGVEAHRAAKSGNLWFAKEGILWGESKPCEFWAVQDVYGKADGVRIVGAGRTCSVILTRKRSVIKRQGEGEDKLEKDVDVEDEIEETEFGMVDSKEREGIYEWVRNHRHLFGKEDKSAQEEDVAPAKVKYSGPLTIRTLQEGSDSDDESFADSVSDLDGSERSSGEDSSSDEEGDGDGSGSGSGSDEEGEGEEEEEEEEMNPAKHPLLRPGAMPRMSKAAMQMAVGIVEEAFVGNSGAAEDDVDEEEDELDD